MAEPAPDLELALRPDLAVIAEALPELERFCAEAGVGAKAANRLQVIIEELVSNTIRHGMAGGGPPIALRLRAEAERLVLVVRDGGRPFDPTARPAPAPLTTLADAPEGGLGIALVRRLSTAFGYRAGAAGEGFVNEVTVVLGR